MRSPFRIRSFKSEVYLMVQKTAPDETDKCSGITVTFILLTEGRKRSRKSRLKTKCRRKQNRIVTGEEEGG